MSESPPEERRWSGTPLSEHDSDPAHRRASDRAGRVAAMTALVALYGMLAAGVLAMLWLAPGESPHRWTPGNGQRMAIAYGIALIASVAGALFAGAGAYLTSRGSFAEGQSTHIGLLLSAGGCGLIGIAMAGFAWAGQTYGSGGWTCCCGCSSVIPFGVAVANVRVLLQWGGALRRDHFVPPDGG